MPVAAVAAALTALFLIVSAFDLSSAQVADRDLGRYGHRVDLDTAEITPGPTAVSATAAATARAHGATDAAVVLETYDVRPATTATSFTTYLETDWTAHPFTSRFVLVSGRWPSHPGEVAVTDAYAATAPGLRAGVHLPTTTTVLSGGATFRVVGRVRDTYGRTSSTLLAAAGTWAGLDRGRLASRYPTLAASADLYWSGGDSTAVAAAVQEAVRPPATADSAPDSSTDTSVLSRSSPSVAHPQDYVSAIPLAYQVPSLILPVVASLLAFGLGARRLRRNLGVLRGIGVRTTDATVSVVLATTGWQVLAVVTGSVVGLALASVARLALQHAATRPLAPMADPVAPTLRTLVLVLACSAVVLVTLLRGHRRTAVRSLLHPLLRAQRVVSPVRRGLVVLAVVVLAVQVRNLDSVPGVMLMVLTSAVIAALAVPDVLPLVLRRLPARDARQRLVRQQLLGDNGRAQTATVAIAATLGLSLSMVVLLTTLVASDSASHVSLTDPGQVSLVAGAGGLATPPAPALVSLARATLGTAEAPLDVGYAYGAALQRTARLAGDPQGVVLVVDSSADAFRLSNGTLDATSRRLLDHGGVVVWEHPRSAERFVLGDDQTGAVVETTEPVPAVVRSFPAGWETKAAGIMLRSTAHQLALPTSHAETVYTGVSDHQARDVRRAVLAGGYDLSQVGPYQKPPPAVAPLAYWGSALGLSIVLLLAVTVVARAQALSLRAYLSGLIALGIPVRWARSVMFRQVGVIAAVGTVTAVLFAVPPIAVATMRIDVLVLAVPWRQVTLLLVLFASAGAAATWHAGRHLRARERLEV